MNCDRDCGHGSYAVFNSDAVPMSGGGTVPGNKKVHVAISFLQVNGELQRQNKLISSKRLFKILQNETKIVKIRQAVLEILNFKDLDLDSFPRKND